MCFVSETGETAEYWLAADVFSTLIRHLDRLTKDGLLRLSLAECSPWVLGGLASFDEMVEKYRKTFVAAAESAVPGWNESFSPTIPRALGSSGR
jgi:hypothetical protein